MSGEKTLVKDFTKGSIPQTLLLFAIPLMLANAFQVLYSAVDMVIVGRFVGKAGLSAVSQSSQILNFATMLVTGFCTGGQILIAQMIGAERRQELSGVIGTLFSFVLILGAAFSAGQLEDSPGILNADRQPGCSTGDPLQRCSYLNALCEQPGESGRRRRFRDLRHWTQD